MLFNTEKAMAYMFKFSIQENLRKLMFLRICGLFQKLNVIDIYTVFNYNKQSALHCIANRQISSRMSSPNSKNDKLLIRQKDYELLATKRIK